MAIYSVAVAGASGYAGAELLRILAQHPNFVVTVAAAGTQAGKPVVSLHPQLGSYGSTTFTETTPSVLAEADLVFLALPHGQSGAIAAALPDETLVVDLGADHRIVDPTAWKQYYGGEHAGSWLYGMPELPGVRQRLPEELRIANPGCYATAITASVWPLLRDNVAESSDIVAVAASGTSGAGRTPSDALLATQVQGSMRAYKVGGVHQHIPEVEQSLSLVSSAPVGLSFTAMLAPMTRGILATTTARIPPGTSIAGVRESLLGAYHDEPFIQVLAPNQWPTTAATIGSNTIQLQVAVDEHAGRAVVVAAMDNLGKGAAGQAIQNANLTLGLPETTGLAINGVSP